MNNEIYNCKLISRNMMIEEDTVLVEISVNEGLSKSMLKLNAVIDLESYSLDDQIGSLPSCKIEERRDLINDINERVGDMLHSINTYKGIERGESLIKVKSLINQTLHSIANDYMLFVKGESHLLEI